MLAKYSLLGPLSLVTFVTFVTCHSVPFATLLRLAWYLSPLACPPVRSLRGFPPKVTTLTTSQLALQLFDAIFVFSFLFPPTFFKQSLPHQRPRWA